MNISENDLTRIIVEEVRRAVSKRNAVMLKEAMDVDDEEHYQSAHILQPQYTDFIATACHILAWKGKDMDIDIRGIAYKSARRAVDMYREEKQEAIKNPKDNKAAVAAVKDKYRKRYPGLVEAEKEGFEMFTKFKEDGFYFISKFIGGKTNTSKQMEKAAGLELFGIRGSGLREFNIKHGAVFCVRDFYKWVGLGCPGLAKHGERLKGTDKEIQGSENFKIRGKDEFAGVRSKGDSDIDIYNKHKEEPELEPEMSEIDNILNNLVNDVIETMRLYGDADMNQDEQKSMIEAIKTTVDDCAQENELPAGILMFYVKAALGALTGVSINSIRDRLEKELENSRANKDAIDKLRDTTSQNGGRLA